jgi:hypothetical protein
VGVFTDITTLLDTLDFPKFNNRANHYLKRNIYFYCILIFFIFIVVWVNMRICYFYKTPILKIIFIKLIKYVFFYFIILIILLSPFI